MSAEPQHLTGRWKMIRKELDGQLAPDLLLANIGMTFSAGTIEVPFHDQITVSGSFRPATNNGTITLLLHSWCTLTNRL